MNYQNIYDNLIQRASARSLSTYTESHHIIPRCMGGSDEILNLVKLTPEEHYLAHQLLAKIYPDNPGLSFAALAMTDGPNRNNKVYGWLRRKHARNISKSETGKVYYNNGVKCIKLRLGDTIPDGYVKGRGWSPTKGMKGTLGSDSFSKSDIQKELAKRRWDKEHSILANKLGLKSINDLPKLVKNYIDEYGSNAKDLLMQKGLSRAQFYKARKVIT